MPKRRLSPFCLITDSSEIGLDRMIERVEAAVRAGVGLVQVREKAMKDSSRLDLIHRLRNRLEGSDARLLINDRLDMALASGADGVHLSSDASVPASIVRRHLGISAVIGVSTHNLDEIHRAETEGADYVTFGPVFETPSKRTYGPPQGLDRLRQAVRATRLPVFALGGLGASNLAQLAPTGVYGWAAIRAWLGDATGDPQPDRLIRCWNQAL